MNDVFALFLSLTVSGSALILLLALLRRVLKGRLGRRWQYYIWLVAVLRLLLPVGFQAGPVSVLMDAAQTQVAAWEAPSWEATGGEASISEMGDALATASAGPPRAWSQVRQSLWLFWLLGTFGLLGKKTAGYRAYLGYLTAGSRRISDEELLEVYGRLCEKLRIRRPPGLYRNSLASAPMLVGVLRPFIVLPKLEEGVNLEDVLSHELIHYKRGDIFYKWLVQLAVCLHWYNPLVYRLAAWMNTDCELSCDEAVIKEMDGERQYAYGETLLAAIQPEKGYSNAVVSITLNEDTAQLRERLDAIMNYRILTRGAKAFSVLTALILAAVAITLGAAAGSGTVGGNTPGVNLQQPAQGSAVHAETTQVPPQVQSAVREYLSGSVPWQLFLKNVPTDGRSYNENQWPQYMAFFNRDSTANRYGCSFFTQQETVMIITVENISGSLEEVVILAPGGEEHYSLKNPPTGQYRVNLPANPQGRPYHLMLHTTGYTGNVLAEDASATQGADLPDIALDSAAQPPLQTGKSASADAAAYHVMTYSGSWDMAKKLLPYMTDEGIDALIALANQKNPNEQRIASPYKNQALPTREQTGARAKELMDLTGNWVYVEPLFPYMNNRDIDDVVAMYNRKTGKRVNAADYHN